jgi:hypothetical protein
MVDDDELLEKYQELLAENSALREENKILKAHTCTGYDGSAGMVGAVSRKHDHQKLAWAGGISDT